METFHELFFTFPSKAKLVSNFIEIGQELGTTSAVSRRVQREQCTLQKFICSPQNFLDPQKISLHPPKKLHCTLWNFSIFWCRYFFAFNAIDVTDVLYL